MDHPANLKQFADWFRYHFPKESNDEDQADKAAEKEVKYEYKPRNGIKLRWEKYKKEFLARQVSALVRNALIVPSLPLRGFFRGSRSDFAGLASRVGCSKTLSIYNPLLSIAMISFVLKFVLYRSFKRFLTTTESIRGSQRSTIRRQK